MASIDRVRNIGIIAHIDAGKTTFTERMLYYAGAIHRMGEVHDGDAQMDYLPQERERGITITAAVTQFPWLGAEVHLIDTPGHVDFTIEVERSLRVLDGAVVVFCGVGGVEPQSEVVWRQADRYRVPRIAFINKMDRPGADFFGVVAQMEKKLSARGVPVTVPLPGDGALRAVADLLTMERVEFPEGDQGAVVVRTPLGPSEARRLSPYREALLEAAADVDDAVAERYLSGEDVPLAMLRGAIRKGTVSTRFFPVYAGAALRNKGIQPAMDGIVHFLPSPAEIPPARGDDPRTAAPSFRDPSPSAPFSALAFKVVVEEGRRTVYMRIYSGRLAEGDTVMVAATGTPEKVARLFRIHAGKRERMEEARAGDIVGVRGLKRTGTGDTLCAPAAPIVYESIEFRKPVVTIAVEPRSLGDMDHLKDALRTVADEDPTITTREDADTGQVILSGMGELHLEIVIERLAREFGLALRTGRPQVVLRETIAQAAKAEELFEREIAERPVSVRVVLSVRPGERGSGIRIAGRLRTLPLHEEIRDAVEAGIREGAFSGSLGYPVDDVAVDVEEAAFLSGTALPLAAKVAAAKAFLSACEKGKPYLLEPIMAVEATVPDEFLGGVIGDINARRGRVTTVDRRPEASLLSALVPLKEMFGYVTALRSLSQGRGTYTMKFSHYDRA